MTEWFKVLAWKANVAKPHREFKSPPNRQFMDNNKLPYALSFPEYSEMCEVMKSFPEVIDESKLMSILMRHYRGTQNPALVREHVKKYLSEFNSVDIG